MLNEKEIKKIQKYIAKCDDTLPFVFNALSDVGRYRIFILLQKHNDLCVTDIANIFNISVPAASQQLKILETNGLVEKERMGQMICYKIKKRNTLVNALKKIIKKFSL